MPHPMPVVPRLGRRKRRDADVELLLGCPRISPEWELGALRALIKPQTKDAILHRPADQVLPANLAELARSAGEVIAQRLHYRPIIHFPDEGDYAFIARVPPESRGEGLALALLMSRALPGVWLTIGRLFLRDGRFFRRERGFRLNLVEATNVHLARPIRAALRGVL